ncbi:hypothetical protein [Bifidobacterium tissieri]|uniref:Uncharacterized protein n=1 Tax=Bifidobacterium tissieri TaxID=1630162 RepID=A0A5M9ZMF2_9BIFI|nr:hypothetical protein [Bifidobacterium tissieri]KAA8828658.1 hypothetical protein EM849_11515 [Bifidobacterium tissieri]KAA8831601.1 hypothetical protein EMO89_02430 [Bifidobacterium tissieri]
MKITIRGKHYTTHGEHYLPMLDGGADEFPVEETCTMEITATSGIIRSESTFIASILSMLSMSGVTDIKVEH